MKKTLVSAFSLCGLSLAANAAAGEVTSTLTMAEVDGAIFSGPEYYYDDPMLVYSPSGAPADKLIVFFHGHAATAGPDGADFLNYASGLGFHAISIDYDYGRDPDGIDNAPRAICGCFSECYGNLHAMILNGYQPGGLPNGLPTTTVEGPTYQSLYPVEDRIRNVISYLATKYPGQDWSHYYSGGAIVWSKIVLVGHSRGTSLVTHLAKYNQVARVIELAGDHDQLVNGDEGATYGDGASGSPNTSYRYGLYNGGEDCTYPSDTANLSPSYLTDNSWTGPSGSTVWATQRAQCGVTPSRGCIYAFSNEADTTAPYDLPFTNDGDHYSFGTAINLSTLGFASVGAGHVTTGNYTTGERSGWETNSPHWLTPGTAGGNDGDICGVGDPHDNVISDHCMNQTLVHDVWRYMLTNAN